MQDELKTKIRDALNSEELERQWNAVLGQPEEHEDDLSWIRAIRDECSSAIRRASNELALLSRLHEFKLRRATFHLIHARDGQRAQRSETRGQLLGTLADCILKEMPDELKQSAEKELLEMLGVSAAPEFDDVVLLEGKTITVYGHRKVIIKKEQK